MNVLSLFDGMSCGHLALDKVGIKVDKYYASEINEDAIKVTEHNYPNTIQLGDVTKIDLTSLPKIDLLIGGSPCQGFSFAGKQLNFEDPRSKLFFEYINVLNWLKENNNPNIIFLLENVKMKKEYQDVISGLLKVEPININSKLVSAQLRNRLYWTNIPNVIQPLDKHILFKDIITSGYVDRDKARCLLEGDSRPHKTLSLLYRRYKTTGFGNIVYEREDLDPEYIRIVNQTEAERLQTVREGYTSIVSRNKALSLLGNGWNVDTVAHIFSFIKE